VYILNYKGTTGWIEPILKEIKKVLDSDEIPISGEGCETCSYLSSTSKL
tara:strand:+ start:82 stop:228 length:147 start_codon:yes stop_codon:yes gene_type:complete